MVSKSGDVALVSFVDCAAQLKIPKGPRTQIIVFYGPNTILLMVFGT